MLSLIWSKKVKKLEQTCFACPSQWEGEFEDGTPLYIRYRWGYLSVSKGVRGEELFGKRIGDGFSGVLSEKAMLRITGLELKEDD